MRLQSRICANNVAGNTLDPKVNLCSDTEPGRFARRGGEVISNSAKDKAASSGYNNKNPIMPLLGRAIPLSMLPPPSTWPLFSAVPAINGRVMSRNINGSGKTYYKL